jgi:hypothetical protein
MDSNNIFWELGLEIIGHNLESSSKVGLRRFKEFFGVSPEVCEISWNLMKEAIPPYSKHKHLLWALFFLKRYNTEAVNRKILNSDEKCLRYWIWIFVDLLANLNVVSFKQILLIYYFLMLTTILDQLGREV